VKEFIPFFLPFSPCVDLARPTFDYYVEALNNQPELSVDVEQMLLTAEALCHMGLAKRETIDPTFCNLHPSLHTHIPPQPPTEIPPIWKAFVAHYQDYARWLYQLAKSDNPEEPLIVGRIVQREYQNFAKAAVWAVKIGETDLLLRWAVWHYHSTQGSKQQFLSFCIRVKGLYQCHFEGENCPQEKAEGWIDLLTEIGASYKQLEKPDQAMHYYQQALEIAQNYLDVFPHFQNVIVLLTQNMVAAEPKLDRQIAILSGIYTHLLEAGSTYTQHIGHNLAETIRVQGDSGRAKDLLTSVLEKDTFSRLSPIKVNLYLSLGHTHRELDEKKKAKQAYTRAGQIARELGLIAEEGEGYLALAILARDVGQLAESDRLGKKAMDLLHIHGSQESQAKVFYLLGSLAYDQDHLGEALEYLDQAVYYFNEVGQFEMLGRAANDLAVLMAELEEWKLAERVWQTALAAFEYQDDWKRGVFVLEQLAKVAEKKGDQVMAQKYLKRAQISFTQQAL